MNFTVPAKPRVKIKENEKRDENFELARELKKLWNMNVTVIPKGKETGASSKSEGEQRTF